MTKDSDRDLIDKMNRALTDEIQTTLEKVLRIQLKPIIKRFDSLEARMDRLEKEQKKQGRSIKNMQKTLDTALRLFDSEDVRLLRSIERIEKHVQLQPVD